MTHSREYNCTPSPWLRSRVAPPSSHFHPAHRSLSQASHHYHSGHLTLLVLCPGIHQVSLMRWCVVDWNPFIYLGWGGIREKLFCLIYISTSSLIELLYSCTAVGYNRIWSKLGKLIFKVVYFGSSVAHAQFGSNISTAIAGWIKVDENEWIFMKVECGGKWTKIGESG